MKKQMTPSEAIRLMREGTGKEAAEAVTYLMQRGKAMKDNAFKEKQSPKAK